MAIWYEVEKSQKGIEQFLDSNWGFHDFRLERVEYTPGKDCLEIFLKYDTGEEGVLLRFTWIHDFHICAERDYEVDWIYGCAVTQHDDTLLWVDDDNWGKDSKKHIEEMKKYASWVEAERIFWAITDGDGNPVEMPANRIDQIWNVYDKRIEKHFELHAFQGDWNSILKPPFER